MNKQRFLQLSGILIAFLTSFLLLFPLEPVSAASSSVIIFEGGQQVADIINSTSAAFHNLYPAYSLQITVPPNQPVQTALGHIESTATPPTPPTIDIAMVARPMRTGDDPGNLLVDKLIGRQVLVMIVNSQSGINSLTYTQIKAIYEGTQTDWSQLGGKPIVPRALQVTSGLWKTFCSNDWFANVAIDAEAAKITATGLPRLNNDQEMINAIASHPDEIGYVGLGSVIGIPSNSTIKCLSVQENQTSTNFVAPTLQNVFNGAYPGSRGLHLFYRASNSLNQQGVTDYINFVLSPAGQDALEAAGAVKVRPDVDLNGDGSINIGDIVVLGLKWGAAGSPGWIKEDINGDGKINIVDVVAIGYWWGFSYTIPSTL